MPAALFSNLAEHAGRRGVLALDHAAVVGMSRRYQGQPNAAAHMEVQTRMPRRNGAAGKLETHIFKANHPDEATVWMADLQVNLLS